MFLNFRLNLVTVEARLVSHGLIFLGDTSVSNCLLLSNVSELSIEAKLQKFNHFRQ